MVSGLRHGADRSDEELWTIAAWWCGRLGVLVDWWRARITTVCCVAGCQPVDGLLVTCHSELRWVQLGCFGTDEIASDVWQFDEISLHQVGELHIVEVRQCMRYLTQEDEDTCRDELQRSRVNDTECPSSAWDCSERGHKFSCSMCVDKESLVTWMMDLGESSLDCHDLDKQDACLGGLQGSYTVGTTDT
jgi:hypothetical protein